MKKQKLNIYNEIKKSKGQIAVLIDPDKSTELDKLSLTIEKSEFANVDYFFVGGSTVSTNDFLTVVDYLKTNSEIPVVIFPGGSNQVSEQADSLLFLSLISGRNPDYLIGHQVQAARNIFNMDLEVIPTGYVLVDGGSLSSVSYVSQTTPIPSNKTEIILDTCKAGILTGKKILFLDAGSGAKNTVPHEVTKKVSDLGVPLIIGGGIKTHDQIEEHAKNGANVIVIGNKLEEDLDFLLDIHNYKTSEKDEK